MQKKTQNKKTASSGARIKAHNSDPKFSPGKPISMGTYTVADALDEYFRDREINGSKGMSVAKHSANAWIIPTLGDVLLSRLSKKHIKDWRDNIAASPRRVRTSTGKAQAYAAPPSTMDERRARRDTANRIMAILKAALNYVYEAYDDLSDTILPCWRKVKRFENTTKPRTRFLTEEEEARLVNACPPDFRDLVQGALLTGCRYGELIRLRCRDYCAKSGTLTIHPDISKSSKKRHIILDKRGSDLFDALVSKRTNLKDLIFTNNIKRTKRMADDGGWLPSDQSNYMKEAYQKAGIERVRFHELRHTYASALVNAGVPLVYVASQLGHSGIGMVEKYYGHLANNDKARAIREAMSRRAMA
jgi:integrase